MLVFGDDEQTLYTFARDSAGQFSCTDACAADWPPAPALQTASVDDFSTIDRADGSLQWSYKGNPLYYNTGDGVGGVWAVSRPAQ